MKTLKLAALAVVLVFGNALADDLEKKTELKIVVADDGADGVTEFSWNSDDMDFDLDDLAVGETRSLNTKSGKPVTVTRTEEGIQFNVDGKTIMMPPAGRHGMHMAVMADGAHDADFDVHVLGNGPHVMRAHHPEGVTVISGKPLDDSVKESIRSVLISAGHQDDVTFIDGKGDGKQVRMIRKRVEVVE